MTMVRELEISTARMRETDYYTTLTWSLYRSALYGRVVKILFGVSENMRERLSCVKRSI